MWFHASYVGVLSPAYPGLAATMYSALLKHAGNPVCEWKNDKVVWVAAENIPVEKHDGSNADPINCINEMYVNVRFGLLM